MNARLNLNLINSVLKGGLLIFGILLGIAEAANASPKLISPPAYKLLDQRAGANRAGFAVYTDQDSGYGHGFPSGFFASTTANLATIHIDTGCIDDPNAINGCSTDRNRLDQKRGTVFRLTFDPQTAGNFAGVNIEEPENYGDRKSTRLNSSHPSRSRMPSSA